jgi:hypothetical protein
MAYLAGMAPATARQYLDAAEAYQQTAAFARFTPDAFAHTVLDVLADVAGTAHAPSLPRSTDTH